MLIKTSFKRIALALVVALGFGVIGNVPASNATVFAEAITIDAATDTATLNDTATAVLTHTWSATANTDTTTIKATCIAPTGGSCPSLFFWQTATSDTANVAVVGTFPTYFNGAWTETASAANVAVRSTVNVKAENFTKVGTYTFSFYTLNVNGTTLSDKSVTWTVTVSAPDLTTASVRKYVATDIYTAESNRLRFAPSSDSAITASAGTAATPVAVGYAYFAVFNAAGDSAVANAAGGANRSTSTRLEDTLTVTVAGPGYVSGISTTQAKTATVNAYNSSSIRHTNVNGSTESITIWSDGTAGTSTITISKGTVTLSTITVIFTGTAASAAISLSDTVTSLGGAGVNLVGTARDAGGNIVRGQTLYVFSSDTAVAGSIPTSTGATTYRTTHACTGSATTGAYSCAITLTDTGTAVLTLRDSWTVSASTWSSNEVTVDVRGNVVRTVSVAFDKATYAPGEKAIISITAADPAGKAMATRADHSVFTQVISTPVVSATGITGQSGTQGTAFDALEFLSLNDGGVETRVVTMPTYGTDVTYEIKFNTFGLVNGSATVSSAIATAKVVDPNATAIATAQAAADAATDAALEAIDAANAATDAANLAAEAADAATVAAEEARDAADAATAAVEALATEVATLMAALKAQITTLARTVAKIAKKVNA